MQKTLILIFFIALKFILQYSLTHPEFELHRDEFLHLDQGNHLAWGYLSVPPFTSWISYLIKLLGNGVFWIRFFPALFGALTIWVVWKAVEALKGDLFAFMLAASCLTFSALLRLNLLYQPNSLDVLCWTTIYYFVIKYLNSYHPKWIYLAAITFAFGFLNKYNLAFLLLGLLPSILLTGERKIFLNRHLYYALGIAVLIILPNLVWQINHDFPVIQHLEALSKTQLVNVNRWSFLRSQLLFFPGTFLVILFGLYALLRYPPYVRYRLFLYAFLLTIMVFLVLKAKDYYAIGIYPIYFAFGSVYLSNLLENKAGRILKPVTIFLVVIIFIPMTDIAFPNKSPERMVKEKDKYSKFGMLTWEDGKKHHLPQDFADMLGWKELAKKVDSVYLEISVGGNTLVLCDNYGQAGAINYYTKQGICAVTFSADYIHWFDLSKDYVHLIRVKEGWEREREIKETSPHFQYSKLADSITNQYAREKGTLIFTFQNAKIDINERIKQELSDRKTFH